MITKMKIVNIVCGLDTKTTINLVQLSKKFPQNAKYNPYVFPGICFRLTSPKATVMVFRSGKMVCTGVNKIDHVYIAFNYILNISNLNIKFLEFIKIFNYVASGTVLHTIDMYDIYKKCTPNCFYNPEIFPALTLKSTKATVNIFSTGKYVILGCKTLADVYETDRAIQQILKNL